VNVAATANDWNISIDSLLAKPLSAESTESLLKSMTRKLTNTRVPKEPVSNWHEIPKAEMTTEAKAELTALRLKAFMDPKKFYKSTDLKKTPERFHFGVMVHGGLRAVGGGQESQTAGTANRNASKGKSLLQEALGDEGVQAWTKKRFSAVNARQLKTAAFGKKFKKTKK
jgi:hypothetical protein